MVADETITPNADGETDATTISYELSRNATVSIYFENTGTGDRHYFRQDKPRGVGNYRVLFSGIVDGYSLPSDDVAGEIIDRLLQDGAYRWVIEAVDERGESQLTEGVLNVVDADSALPDLTGFQIYPTTFTPNRDGIDDRVKIQFFQTKEAETLVNLIDVGGVERPIQELPRELAAGESINTSGRRVFDYEGGVDLGAQPPADGVYEIVAIAEDDEGQKVRVSGELEIAFGGVPRAEIISPPTADTLQFSTNSLQICDTLTFTTTIRNYGEAPIRTTGPAPGTVYDSQENYNSAGWPTESGAFRIAIGFENELKDYPYRWALGTEEQLTRIGEFLYLMPGQQVTLTGGIKITDMLGERNPQPMWVGLIHEDVAISQFNNRVDPHAIEIEEPEEIINCE